MTKKDQVVNSHLTGLTKWSPFDGGTSTPERLIRHVLKSHQSMRWRVAFARGFSANSNEFDLFDYWLGGSYCVFRRELKKHRAHKPIV